MGMSASVRQIGCDCHRRFSTVTARDEHNRVVWRERRTNDHLVVSTQKSAIATEGSAGLRQSNQRIDKELQSHTTICL